MDYERKVLLEQLISFGVIKRESVELSSGQQSDFYVDVKEVYGRPHQHIFRQLIKELHKLLPHDTTCIAGGGYGGLIPASYLGAVSHLNVALVRERKKSHGRGKTIEGYIPVPGDRVVVVDDVYTLGNSAYRMRALVEATGATVTAILVVVQRQVADINIPVLHLFTPDDFGIK